MARYGIRQVVRHAWPVIRKNHLFGANLENLTFAPSAFDETYEVCFPWDGDTCRRELLAIGLSPEAYQMRKDAGDLLGVIRRGTRVVHRSFVQTRGHVRLAGDRGAFLLKEHEAYVHYCETLDAERGRGLYQKMLRTILQRLAGLGTKEVFISCEQQNIASIRGILGAGFDYKISAVSTSILWGRLHHSFWYRDGKNAMAIGLGR